MDRDEYPVESPPSYDEVVRAGSGCTRCSLPPPYELPKPEVVLSPMYLQIDSLANQLPAASPSRATIHTSELSAQWPDQLQQQVNCVCLFIDIM